GGDFRPGAGGGWNADQRPDGAGNLVVTGIITDVAAVAEDDGDDLGQVHVATAAKRDQHVWLVFACRFQTGLGDTKRRLRLAASKDIRRNAAGRERFLETLHQSCFDQYCVGDNQGLFRLEPLGEVTVLPDGVAADEKLGGRVEGPGG